MIKSTKQKTPAKQNNPEKGAMGVKPKRPNLGQPKKKK